MKTISIEFQVSGWYVKLSPGINTTMHINGCIPVCTFFNNQRVVQEITVRRIVKYLTGTYTYVDLPDIN